MRSRLPSFVVFEPTRTPLPAFASNSITFEMCIGAAFSRMPPGCVWLRGRVCRLTMLRFSTVTRFFFSSTAVTRPVLPLSSPAMTMTMSPLRILMAIR